MTLAPFFDAPIYIQLHASTAALALILGPFVILRTARDRLHKVGGYIWVLAMFVVAVSSFWITEFGLIGPFSPIHLLSAFTLWSLWAGMRYAFAGRMDLHRRVFQNLYWRGLVIAGLFNFLPGRALNRSVLPDRADAGWLVIGFGMTLILGDMALRHRRAISLERNAKFALEKPAPLV
ncbi:DUF2306 domain-containing protein [Rhodobacterales bacterium HKCCA1288]|jgi:uncharacterized membrane protein|uniref:DUF2306 domain-containing protein n=1 Tax=Roseovarius sp. 10 TaxID=3080563 RepID=UPI00193599AA|nr:DUF2306 domain-containing protein [Roseovarius sp. 10]MDV7200579.1 DUF2306 domain-containing protein [Roseovarius sp. 10]QPI85502.1 DUF2306 domain-containing protein [Rhodobacterales bacterium HKCCA1288]